MKLILFLLLIVPISVNATSSIVMDQNSNRVLYCINCYDEALIASTTKIITARG